LQVYEVTRNEMSRLPELKSHSKLKKDSTQKVVEVSFSTDNDLLSVLS